MRPITLFLALAALAPAGCVETDPKKGAAADRPPPTEALRQAEGPPRPDREPDDDADPVIRAAEQSAKRVASLEETIDASLTELGNDIRTLSATDRRATDLTAEKLLAAVQMLRQSGERITDRYPKVKADLDAIARAGPQLRIAYAHAKATYLEKSDLVAEDLKERYAAMADLCDAFLRDNDDRTKKYAEFGKDLAKAVAKVHGHIAFLKDFEAFLKLNPATQGAKGREEFMDSLNRFAEQILQFGDVLKLFRDKVREGAVSQRLRDEHERTLAAAVIPPAVPVGEPSRDPAAPQAVAPQVTEKTEPASAPVTAVADSPAGPSLAGACRQPVMNYVPVQVTRCVATLVPVTCYRTVCGPLGRARLVADTRLEVRNQFVTETRYAAVWR